MYHTLPVYHYITLYIIMCIVYIITCMCICMPAKEREGIHELHVHVCTCVNFMSTPLTRFSANCKIFSMCRTCIYIYICVCV